MPAAPSYERLLDMQANVERSFADYFTANGLTAFHSRSTGNLPDARLIVQAEIGASQGHFAVRTKTGTQEQEDDWFSITFTIYVQTERTINTAAPDVSFASLHDYWCARVKTLMLRGSLNGTTPGVTALDLGYYRVAVQGFQGEQYDASDEALDSTVIAYALQLQILAEAWPVSGD